MFAFPLWNQELKELLHNNQARGPYWENITRGLSGTDLASLSPYKKD